MDNTPSCSSTFSGTDDITLSRLEQGSYLSFSSKHFSIDSTKTNVENFSKFLNSAGRLAFLNCDGPQCAEFVFLLLTLKRNIKYCLKELGRSKNKEKYSFICCECNEVVEANENQNFWTSIQNHEHFEQRYCNFLAGEFNPMDVITDEMKNITFAEGCEILGCGPSTSNAEGSNENTDSGIDNENCEVDHNYAFPSNPLPAMSKNSVSNKEDNARDNVNSFRFDFHLQYDKAIENKLYTQSLMKAIRRIDQVEEYTIQKTSPSRAVCLLCNCELLTRAKISKSSLLDHCMGQRHLKCASTPQILDDLYVYHEIWVNMEPPYQAHQVYFRPELVPNFICILCNMVVKSQVLKSHIETDPHKMKVLQLFEKNSNLYFCVNLQVGVYGITEKDIGDMVKEKEIKLREPRKMIVKNKEKNNKTDSDSSPPSDSKEFEHNIIKSVQDATSSNVLDQIPNRLKDHAQFFQVKKGGKSVSCSVCKTSIEKKINLIKKHIFQAMHIDNSKIPLVQFKYYCEICNIKIIDENTWDRHFANENKHDDVAQSRKDKLAEYECTKCCTVIFGDDLSLTRHLSINLRRGRKRKEIKLPEALKKLFRTKEDIENEAAKLTHGANDSLRYNELTINCCKQLEMTLAEAFEGCKVYPFGSRISGLGDRYSDLDVFIDTGDMYTGCKNQDPMSQVKFVRKAAGTLSKHKDLYQDVFQIPTARTPIVGLFHKQTEIDCDLSFRHGLSVENTKFLRFCITLQPITQPFILLLKRWSAENNLTEHITTYALAIMAIFFLQIKNHLLSVKKLRELNPDTSLVINGWETINYTMTIDQMKTYVEPCPLTVTELIKGFFEYYFKFPYDTDVVCPLLGHTVQKSLFHSYPIAEILQKEMKSYITQLDSRDPETFRALSPICIQDPFDLSHNLTKACQASTVNKFKTLCEISLKLLESP